MAVKALEDGKAGAQHCTHQLHARQHLQQRDEVVAVPQVLIEVIDVLTHLEGRERDTLSVCKQTTLQCVHLKWSFQEDHYRKQQDLKIKVSFYQFISTCLAFGVASIMKFLKPFAR